MKFSEESQAILLPIVFGAVVFGLIIGALVFYETLQLKGAIIIPQNVNASDNLGHIPPSYFYRDEQGVHVFFEGGRATLNTTLLPQVSVDPLSKIPLNTCYLLTISLDIPMKQMIPELRQVPQSYCGLP